MELIRTKKFVPECFGDEYSGFIIVRKMTHDDIANAMENLGMVEMDGKEMSTKDNFDWLKNCFNMAKEYLVSAEVTKVSTGEKLGLEDLMYETELKTFRSDIAKGFLNSWAMGNVNAQRPA